MNESPDYAMPDGSYGTLSPAAYLVNVALDTVLAFLSDLIMRTLTAPADRLVQLTAVEGELKRQRRLPAKTGFGGILGLIKRIYKKEGLSGFYRGLLTDAVLGYVSPAVDTIALSAVSTLLGAVIPRTWLEHMSAPQAIVLSIVASQLCALLACPYNSLRKSIVVNYTCDIVAPVEGYPAEQPAVENADDGAVADESSTNEAYRYATATEAVATIRGRKGFSAFYRGALVDPVMISVYRGIFIAASLSVSQDSQAKHTDLFFRMAAFFADFATQPFEVVSRRLILTASADETPDAAADPSKTEADAAGKAGDVPYDGIIDCAKKIVAEEGITALWAGLRFRVLWNLSTIAIRALLVAVLTDNSEPQLAYAQ